MPRAKSSRNGPGLQDSIRSYCSSGFRECSRFRVLIIFTCRRPGANVRAFLPRTPNKISSVVFLKAKLVLEENVDGEISDRAVSHDTHKVDYLKDRVAFDLEWNSKDQTFDRDLAAFRSFFEYDKISVGVLLTRSTSLETWFRTLGNCLDKEGEETDRPVYQKYGASTTHMNKLLPRLEAGRGGGCPVLAFGITQRLVEK